MPTLANGADRPVTEPRAAPTATAGGASRPYSLEVESLGTDVDWVGNTALRGDMEETAEPMEAAEATQSWELSRVRL